MTGKVIDFLSRRKADEPTDEAVVQEYVEDRIMPLMELITNMNDSEDSEELREFLARLRAEVEALPDV